MSSLQSLPLILINGRPGNQIPIDDRAIHYGDGLFETVAVKNGVACLLDLHMQRLQNGLERLAFPAFDLSALKSDITSNAAGFDNAVLKIIVTRGSGPRGYRPPVNTTPVTVLMFNEHQALPSAYFEEGVEVFFCDTRLGINPLLAGIKHLNRLEQVIARQEWTDSRFYEGLMQDLDGFVIEATSSNMFIWKDGALATPDLSRCGIAGVMRQLLIDTTESLGIDCAQRKMTKQDCLNADALLLCNSLTGIVPVGQLENRIYDRHSRPTEFIKQVMAKAFA